MKSHSCGWRVGRSLGRRSYGFFSKSWRRGKPRMHDENTQGVESYMDHVVAAASFEDFQRRQRDNIDNESRASAETLPENGSLIDFKAFAREYPDKLFPLLIRLRPEFQELFIEFYLLGKSQYFIGPTHGFIQTRVWQTLRIIEQMIGSMILLGPDPNYDTLKPILEKAQVERTEYGSLTEMILYYAASQSYAVVAERFRMPIPVVRKIFRPAITQLLADKDVKAVAVGSYLRCLTHWASLTKVGLSKSCKARLRRVRLKKFTAPAGEVSPLISFGHTEALQDIPWCMFEISSEHRMAQLAPNLRVQGKHIFGKKAAQIFAPVHADGELAYGYIFARAVSQSLVRSLTRIRGISEMAALYDDEGGFVKAMTVPDTDVQKMLESFPVAIVPTIHVGDFVEILTGDAARYCGTVLEIREDEKIVVEVSFPTGRKFLVTAEASSLKPFPATSASKRTFWGAQS